MFIPTLFIVCYGLALGVEVVCARKSQEEHFPCRACAELWLLGVGLFFHTLFLVMRILDSARSPLSSAQDALLVLVWVLASITIGLISTYRKRHLGRFLLPMMLILLGVAFGIANTTPFAARPASLGWGMVHGISMLVAAVAIFCGFLSGTLYLRQAWKLKHLTPQKSHSLTFRLPSLEWLYYANRHSMKLATSMLALGVLSGIVLNLQKNSAENLLADWMILGTGGLLLWFVFSLVLGFFWKRANAGPQIAYRTILNFVALCTLFGLVIFSQHRIELETLPILETPVIQEIPLKE